MCFVRDVLFFNEEIAQNRAFSSRSLVDFDKYRLVINVNSIRIRVRVLFGIGLGPRLGSVGVEFG